MIDSTAIIDLSSAADPWTFAMLNADQTNLPEEFLPRGTFWQSPQTGRQSEAIVIVYSPDDISFHDYILLGLPHSRHLESIKLREESLLPDGWGLSSFGSSMFHVVSINGLEGVRRTPLRTALRRHFARGMSLSVAFDAGSAEWGHPHSAALIRGHDESLDSQIDLVTVKNELLRWLGISHDELSAISGIHRGTLFNWARSKVVPRAKTTTRLLRVYALVRALRRRLGTTETAAWFRCGTPSPLDLLHEGEFDRVEKSAASLLFQDVPPDPFTSGAFAPEFDLDIQAAARPDLPRRSSRGRRT